MTKRRMKARMPNTIFRFFPPATHLGQNGFAGHRSLTAQSSMHEIFYDFTNGAITSLCVR
jgi:hypothetical protein